MTEDELNITKEEVDEIYQLFLSRVSNGRNMDLDEVHQIARGRVWTGKDALDNGLIDELGGLKEAISFARNKAGIKNDMILYYPKVEENKFESLIEALNEEENTQINSGAIKGYEFLNKITHSIKKVENLKGIQMRLPYDIDIN